MIQGLFSMEQLRLVCTIITSSLIAAVAPAGVFLLALSIAFGFNVWCGMRADGVIIHNCDNFKMSKFVNAIKEVILYASIILTFTLITYYMGRQEYGIYAVEVITWVFIMTYVQNSFKNLVKAYPESAPLRTIYLIIRLEFSRATPENVAKGIEDYILHQERLKNLQNETNK